MNTRSFILLLALTSATCLAPSTQAQTADNLKSADELVRAWDRPLTRSARVTTRSTTASKVVIDNYRTVASSVATRGGTDRTRGIEVVPINQSEVQVSVEVEPQSAVSFDNILFKLDTDEFLDENSRQQVLIIAQAMNKLSGVAFLIEGHTCDLGTDDHNKTLSVQRAARIVSVLKSAGVNAERLLPLGFGETSPEVANTNETSRQKNRRVTIYKRS